MNYFPTLTPNGGNPYSFVLSVGSLPCKDFSDFFLPFAKVCLYKIGERRKPPLEALLCKGFKSKGRTYLFPARGRKRNFKNCVANFFVESHLPLPRKGTETLIKFWPSLSALTVALTSSPQGDGNGKVDLLRCGISCRTYLFPARGRKHIDCVKKYRLFL